MSLHSRIFCPKTLLIIILTALFSSVASGAPAPVVTTIGLIASGVRTPVRLAADASENIYVTNPRGGGVLKFRKNGIFLRNYSSARRPQGIAIRGDGSLIVSQGAYVHLIDKDLDRETRKLGTPATPFQMANGIAIGPSSQIYVVDSLAQGVKYFSSDGTTLLGSFGGPGSGPGQFAQPTGIAYDTASGHLAVVDTLSGRIQFFDGSGVYQRSIVLSGSRAGKFTSPQGVAFEYDSTGALSRIYVVDSFQSIIQVLDSSGNLLPISSASPYIGGYGKEAGKLLNPSDLLLISSPSAGKRLIVANSLGNLTLYGINGGSTPIVSVTPPFQSVTTNSVTIGGTLEPDSSVTIYRNGIQVGTSSDSTWSVAVGGLNQGANQITVVATDSMGNTSSMFYPVNRVLSLPAGPVDFAISTLSGSSSAGSQLQNISGTASPGVQSVTMTVNGGTPQIVPVLNGTFSTQVALNSSTGTNSISVSDSSGAITRTIILDPAAVLARIVSPVDGAVVNTTPLTVTGSSPAGTTVAMYVNGSGTPQATAWNQPIALSNGMNTIEAVVTDTSTGRSSSTKTTVIYNAALTLAVASPAGDYATSTARLTMNGSTSAEAVSVAILPPGSTTWADIPIELNSGLFSIPLAFGDEGIYRLALTAADSQGNPVTTYRNITFDTSSPSIYVADTMRGQTTISGTATSGAVVYLRNSSGSDIIPPVISNGTWTLTGLPGAYNPQTMNLSTLNASGNSSRNGHLLGTGTGTSSADIRDAIKALRIVARLDSASDNNLLYGDVAPLVNGVSMPDGRIDLDDLLLIMRKTVGLPWN